MITINIDDVPRDLPAFLERLQSGETVYILQNNRPVAQLIPTSSSPRLGQSRPSGLCKGEFVVPDDFDAPLPDYILAEFESA